jgi:hypothetical protein
MVTLREIDKFSLRQDAVRSPKNAWLDLSAIRAT